MGWVLILLTVWVLIAVAAAVVIGRGVQLADAEAARDWQLDLVMHGQGGAADALPPMGTALPGGD